MNIVTFLIGAVNIYLHDLLQESHMGFTQINNLAKKTLDENLCVLLKVYILLHADDR